MINVTQKTIVAFFRTYIDVLPTIISIYGIIGATNHVRNFDRNSRFPEQLN